MAKQDLGGADRWWHRAGQFVHRLWCPQTSCYASVPAGPPSLYGTCYALLTKVYVGARELPHPDTKDFVLGCQDPTTGLFRGPELADWEPPPSARHSNSYVQLHLTATTLPVCHQFGWIPRHRLHFAEKFLHPRSLRNWLAARDLADAWLEGNNLLFAGQILVYLRDVEKEPRAGQALQLWFDYLDQQVDPRTGLWGLIQGCPLAEAMYGGYHQLLVYYHETHPILHAERLIDAVLSLQHPDGGFARDGGGGACEDVDAVDILVNLYKRVDYRRPDIRWGLRRCLRHLLRLQNPDGGFPYSAYRKYAPFTHMGIEATRTTRGGSAIFPTWFRVHAMALIREILTDEPDLITAPLSFSSSLSMGWHRPSHASEYQVGPQARAEERAIGRRRRLWLVQAYLRHGLRRARGLAGMVCRALHSGFRSGGS